jgi:hypothetical protein
MLYTDVALHAFAVSAMACRDTAVAGDAVTAAAAVPAAAAVTAAAAVAAASRPAVTSIKLSALPEACCASGLSYIVQDTASGDILSKSLALPFDHYKTLELDDHPTFRPVLAVFDALDSLPVQHEQSAVLNFVWATHSNHMNKGYAKKVVQGTMQAARQAGFASIIADFTNVVSQRMGEAFGYQPHVKVRYHDFEPFKSITCTDLVIRSIKQLEAASGDQKQQQEAAAGGQQQQQQVLQ